MTDSAIKSFSAAKSEVEDKPEPFNVTDLDGTDHRFEANFNVDNGPMLEWMESGRSIDAFPSLLKVVLGQDEYERYKALHIDFATGREVVMWMSEEIGGGLGN